MNRFVPLLYVWDTLTLWHAAIWLAVPVLIGIVLPLRGKRPIKWGWLARALLALAVMYALLAIVIGQLFGDTFTLAALWPSSALLSTLLVGMLIASAGPGQRPPLGIAIAFVVAVAAFFSCALWFLPRAVGLGLIDFPEASWGVHLYRAP